MNTATNTASSTLAEIIAKIASQGDKADLTFLNNNTQAQSMLLSALLQTANPALNTNTTATAANNSLNPQLLNQLIASLTSDLAQNRDQEIVKNHQPAQDSRSSTKEDKLTKKKVGRKPVTSDEDNSDDPKLKRKAQNRAAQRAFRERKETQVRLLEEKVKQLEETLSIDKDSKQLAEENRKLKDMIAELQRENELIKASTTSFNIPLTASLGDTDGERPNKLVRQNLARHQFLSSNSNDRASSSPEREEEKNAMSSRRSNSKSSSSSNSSDMCNSMITPEMTIDDILNLDATVSATTTPSASSLSMLPISNSIFNANDLFGAPSPHLITDTTTDYSKQLSDLLAEHRTALSTDPAQFDFFYPLPANMNLNAENSAAAAATLGALDSSASAPNSAMNTTSRATPAMFDTATSSALTDLDKTTKEDVASFKTESITNVWDKLAEHPRFSEFDLDLLCEEMKHKAVCTEPCTKADVSHEKELLSLVEKHYPSESN